MKIFTGLNAKSAENMQLDAGMIAVGLKNPASFTGTLTEGEKSLGATAGGGSFTAVPELRNILEGVDGAGGSIKGGRVIDNWEVKLTFTLKEMTAESFQLAIGASNIKKATASNKYDTVTAKNVIELSDYLSNICFLGTQVGSDLPIIIEVKNALSIGGCNFTFADKDTGGLEIEMEAHFDLNKMEEVPFAIHVPSQLVK